MKTLTLILVLMLALVAATAGSAQMELSCTASQQVAIQSRLGALPPEERQRFSADAGQLQHEMHQLHEEAKKSEDGYRQVVGAAINQAFGNDPALRDRIIQSVYESRKDLVEKAIAAVTGENPELAQQSGSGDSDARSRLEAFVWDRLRRDPEFNREFEKRVGEDTQLQKQLLQNSQLDARRAALVELQQRLNKTERKQAEFLYGLRSADGEQKADEAAYSAAEQRQIPLDAINNSRAVRDLLVTAAYVERIGEAGDLERGSDFAMQKFDSPVAEPDALQGLYVEAAQVGREAMRKVTTTRLEVSLGVTEAHLLLPKAELRPAVMKNTESKYARSTVRTAGQLLNSELRSRQASQTLKIKAPPSPDMAAAASPDGWAKDLATKVKAAGKKAVRIIMVEE